mmetsp:Transcript_124152/g.359023  ORF Transcript_124152/g.359023 Transcript_124152/m.359023 type:complete len:230 (-) Transcript_124152:1236-1925(-)
MPELLGVQLLALLCGLLDRFPLLALEFLPSLVFRRLPFLMVLVPSLETRWLDAFLVRPDHFRAYRCPLLGERILSLLVEHLLALLRLVEQAIGRLRNDFLLLKRPSRYSLLPVSADLVQFAQLVGQDFLLRLLVLLLDIVLPREQPLGDLVNHLLLCRKTHRWLHSRSLDILDRFRFVLFSQQLLPHLEGLVIVVESVAQLLSVDVLRGARGPQRTSLSCGVLDGLGLP